MTDASPIAAILACAVPVAAGVVVFKRPLAAAWDGPVCRELRNSPWPVRAAGVVLTASAVLFGGGKGGTNAIQSAESGPTNAVAVSVAASTNAVESATDAETLARALENLDEAEAIRLGLEPQPAAAGVPLLPAWYQYDPADADQDGMPDLWETWTRSAPATFDSHLDLDDDGLNALYEFWNQTDPRTADTDGDGFPDGFEAANGMDPLVKADFTPVEPDANSDGIPDLWEGSGFLYGFHDSDHDGFDDTYATYFLPAPSDANFDVLVDVRSSRTAALVWPTPTGDLRMVLPPTATGTVVRLRLPFGEDQALRLLPAPEGVAPPAGQLWKSRLRVSFLARSGQTAAGTCLVAADGAIVQRVATRESAVARFPDDPAPQPLSGSPMDGWPWTDILRRQWSITPGTDVYHQAGDTVGPFQVTGAVNIPEASVVWSADHGTMSPTNGPESSLTVTSVPGGDGRIVVSAALRLDPDFATNRTAVVTPCPRSVFSLDDCTANFAPLPESNAVFTVTLPGCSHANDPGWLEAEVVRVTTEGTQHVAWVDMDASAAGVDRYGAATNLPQHATFSWDGIAQASLDLAEYPEVFAAPNRRAFHLAAPAVSVGQPVPPPRVTLVVRLRDADKAAVLAEASRTIHVPQIVQVVWQPTAEALFRTPKVYAPDATRTNLVYSADYVGDSAALMRETLAGLRAYYPASVNIVFVPFVADVGTTKILFVTPELHKFLDSKKRVVYEFGVAPPHWSVQRSAGGVAFCHLGSIYDRTFTYHSEIADGDTASPPFSIPVSSAQMLDAICRVSAHEVGHTLGLVDPTHLDGVGKWHNPGAEDQSKMMNVNTDLRWLYNPQHPPVGWRTPNRDYLEFVLPVSD